MKSCTFSTVSFFSMLQLFDVVGHVVTQTGSIK